MEETVSCFCKACSQELGQFRNAWNVIGNNYYSPVYPILTYEDGFVGKGDVRIAKLGNHEDCHLQDLVCKSCRVYLGIRCDSAPQGHILKKNQYLLRLSEITTLIAGTSQKAEISVKNAFILEAADSTTGKKSKSRAPSMGPSRSKSMSAHPPSFRHSSMMAPPPTPTPKATGTAPIRVTVAAPAQVPSVFEIWVEKEIKDQRKDIDRISGAVDRIEKTMDDIKDFMVEVRRQHVTDQERQEPPRSEAVQRIKTDLHSLQKKVEASDKKCSATVESLTSSFNKSFNGEMKRLVQHVEGIGKKGREDVNGLKTELSAMNSSMTVLESAISSSRGGNVDELKKEMSILKAKMMILEASSKKMRADAVAVEASRQRKEALLKQKGLEPSKKTEVIPMQRALELAGIDDEVDLTSYGMEPPSSRDGAVMKPRTLQSSEEAEVIPMQQALELAGMVDETDSAPYLAPYSGDSSRTRNDVIPAQRTGRTRTEAAPPQRRTSGSSRRAEAIHNPSAMEPLRRKEAPSGQKAVEVTNGSSEAQQGIAPVSSTKSMIRIEISPMKSDEGFPADLSSPDSSDSDVESIPAISPVAKRKRAEPSNTGRRDEHRDLAWSQEYQPKRRRVSDQGSDDGEASSQSENGSTSNPRSPEPEKTDIISSDNSSPDLGEAKDVNRRTTDSEREQGERLGPELGQNTDKVLSMLNEVARRPFRTSFGPSTEPPPLGSAYDQTPILNVRTRAARDQNIASGKPRDSEGNLLRPSGEPDRRSSRYQRNSLQESESIGGGGKGAETPARTSNANVVGPSNPKNAPRPQPQDFSAPLPVPPQLRKTLSQVTPGQEKSVFDSIERDNEDVRAHKQAEARESPDPLATPEQIQNPYKCGVCLRRFAKAQALKIHKNYHPACKADASRDEVPSDFVCSGCEQSFVSLITFNRHKCPSNSDVAKLERDKVNEEEYRRRAMVARDQFVKELLEKEVAQSRQRENDLF